MRRKIGGIAIITSEEDRQKESKQFLSPAYMPGSSLCMEFFVAKPQKKDRQSAVFKKAYYFKTVT
ncbi:MAG: hypothetical protein IKB70_10185 [Bacilli bacterium]|nr:hypothetical protein [Bacilli bacterium]